MVEEEEVGMSGRLTKTQREVEMSRIRLFFGGGLGLAFFPIFSSHFFVPPLSLPTYYYYYYYYYYY